MIDELASRRADWMGGMNVRLADGQEWAIPRPRLYWVPDDTEEGAAREWDLGPEYGRLFQAWRAEDDPDKSTGRMIGLMKHLLLRNYDLDGDQVRSLLRLSFAEDAEPGMVETREALMDLAMGRTPGPKPSSGGLA